MFFFILNVLLALVVFLVPGVIALIRAFGAPSGKGLVFAGGGLLTLSGLVEIGWQVWFHLLVSFDHGAPLIDPLVLDAYNVAHAVLVAVAVALLLCAVPSARGTVQPNTGAPTPHGHPGYQPAPGHHAAPWYPGPSGQPYPQQAPGVPQAHQAQYPSGPQQPPQPPQAPQGPQPEQR
ncbi:hypothetical protein AB0I72_03985 [Nocardiopsis sp. NPDC049922]|uniref:hypothetical protein n=1 Tax=Nocardiopsis sp. NPDC049922 TaxID=3155157 RepID=UPI0033F74ACC